MITNLTLSLVFWVIGSILFTFFSQAERRGGDVAIAASCIGFAAAIQWVGIWFMVG